MLPIAFCLLDEKYLSPISMIFFRHKNRNSSCCLKYPNNNSERSRWTVKWSHFSGSSRRAQPSPFRLLEEIPKQYHSQDALDCVRLRGYIKLGQDELFSVAFAHYLVVSVCLSHTYHAIKWKLVSIFRQFLQCTPAQTGMFSSDDSVSAVPFMNDLNHLFFVMILN